MTFKNIVSRIHTHGLYESYNATYNMPNPAFVKKTMKKARSNLLPSYITDASGNTFTA